jgi:hypothetical protein
MCSRGHPSTFACVPTQTHGPRRDEWSGRFNGAWLLRYTPLSDPHLAPGVASVEELARQAALSGYNSDAFIEVCAAALRGSKAERRNKDDDTGCDQHEAQDHFADN